MALGKAICEFNIKDLQHLLKLPNTIKVYDAIVIKKGEETTLCIKLFGDKLPVITEGDLIPIININNIREMITCNIEGHEPIPMYVPKK